MAEWIDSQPSQVTCLEVTAEHFFDDGRERLEELRSMYPLYVHGLGLSLGSRDGIQQATLDQFAQIVDAADPEWVSEHVAFTRTADVDLGHLNPVTPSLSTLETIAANVDRVQQRCQKPVLLENVTSHLRMQGEFSEADFLNRLCETAGCHLLLDVTNLFINSRNHEFDAVEWLREIEPQNIVQLHIVGYSLQDGRWQDYHREPIQEDLWTLYEEVVTYAPVKSVIIERDANFNQDDVQQDLERLNATLAKTRPLPM
jgi:hypothetical protein